MGKWIERTKVFQQMMVKALALQCGVFEEQHLERFPLQSIKDHNNNGQLQVRSGWKAYYQRRKNEAGPWSLSLANYRLSSSTSDLSIASRATTTQELAVTLGSGSLNLNYPETPSDPTTTPHDYTTHYRGPYYHISS